jgi:hypothetical protein
MTQEANEPDIITKTSISQASSLAEIAEFWDTHSVAGYWEMTEPVEFVVTAKRRGATG